MKKKRRIEIVIDRERICVVRRNFSPPAASPKNPEAPEPEKHSGSTPARKEKV